eukprot:1011196-Amphidinium_carterae.1
MEHNNMQECHLVNAPYVQGRFPLEHARGGSMESNEEKLQRGYRTNASRDGSRQTQLMRSIFRCQQTMIGCGLTTCK